MKPTFDEQLLLAEYQHFSESLWRNEEIGEKRVSYFISLVTAVLTGLVAIDVTNLGDKVDLPSMILAFLTILLVVGILTFLRMLRRNRVTDEYQSIIKYLREEMRVRSVSLSDYHIRFDKPKYLLRGGLAEMVAALNALIVAALIYFIGNSEGEELPVILFMVLGAAIVFALQALPIMRRRGQGKNEPTASPRITQTFRAGVGLLIQHEDGRLLAYERLDHPDSWQFPQGGIDDEEEPLEAAYRELHEETGLNEWQVARPQHPPVLTVYELPRGYRSVKTGRGQAQYWFLFRFTGTDKDISLGDGKEFSKWAWMTIDEVIQKTVGFRKRVYRQLQEQMGI
ncbi:MAG: RNA pyrophosphohydrolase [Saprospiraceae bacterium]|nr:RNA pyrophosphohydrolase [Saprospiraceae bacterium]